MPLHLPQNTHVQRNNQPHKIPIPTLAHHIHDHNPRAPISALHPPNSTRTIHHSPSPLLLSGCAGVAAGSCRWCPAQSHSSMCRFTISAILSGQHARFQKLLPDRKLRYSGPGGTGFVASVVTPGMWCVASAARMRCSFAYCTFFSIASGTSTSQKSCRQNVELAGNVACVQLLGQAVASSPVPEEYMDVSDAEVLYRRTSTILPRTLPRYGIVGSVCHFDALGPM